MSMQFYYDIYDESNCLLRNQNKCDVRVLINYNILCILYALTYIIAAENSSAGRENNFDKNVNKNYHFKNLLIFFSTIL